MFVNKHSFKTADIQTVLQNSIFHQDSGKIFFPDHLAREKRWNSGGILFDEY